MAGAPVVKTLPSDVRDVDLIPGKEAKISYTSKAKKKNKPRHKTGAMCACRLRRV